MNGKTLCDGVVIESDDFTVYQDVVFRAAPPAPNALTLPEVAKLRLLAAGQESRSSAAATAGS